MDTLFERKILSELLSYLNGREALVVVGARQVGKTSLLKFVMEKIKEVHPVFYFDLEDLFHLRLLNAGVSNFLSYLDASGLPRDRRAFVFIDEFHYMENPSSFVKLMVDHHSNRVKLVLTGSSSLELKKKFKESLVGRKFIFNLYPLDFSEFLIFKGEKRFAEILPQDPFSTIKEDPTRFFVEDYNRYGLEFLLTGGYPAVVLENVRDKKIKLLSEIVQGYVYKDVQTIFSLDNLENFDRVVKFLAVWMGNLLNITEIGRSVSLSRDKVKKYIDMLKGILILEFIYPYSVRHRNEVVKTPRVYFVDNGLRNLLIEDFSPIESRGDRGEILENAVFTGLLKHKSILETIYFWRTQTKTEVDFILKREEKLFPIEVNWSGRRTRALLSFVAKYKTQKGYVIYPGPYREEANISYIPLWWIL
jgi:predicted AAA+ superfamily ATPase